MGSGFEVNFDFYMFLSFVDQFMLDLDDAFGIFSPMGGWTRAVYPEFYRQKILDKLYKKYKNKKRVTKTLYYFKKQNYINTKVVDGQRVFYLSPHGYSKILKIKLKLKRKKLKKDGKYRIIIFDIPEKEKLKREYFRKGLKCLGFQQLQKSVWVSPYDVFKELRLFAEDCRLTENVKYILATKIE